MPENSKRAAQTNAFGRFPVCIKLDAKFGSKIHFGPCLGILPETRAKHRFRVRSRQTPGNARFARPSIGIERFSGENIRWAKARCLGRGETCFTKTSFMRDKARQNKLFARHVPLHLLGKRSDLPLSGTFISRFLDFYEYSCRSLLISRFQYRVLSISKKDEQANPNNPPKPAKLKNRIPA